MASINWRNITVSTQFFSLVIENHLMREFFLFFFVLSFSLLCFHMVCNQFCFFKFISISSDKTINSSWFKNFISKVNPTFRCCYLFSLMLDETVDNSARFFLFTLFFLIESIFLSIRVSDWFSPMWWLIFN